MLTKNFDALFTNLMEQYCLSPGNLLFVNNIAEWCQSRGIQESDADKPVKLVMQEPGQCGILVRNDLTDEIIQKRMNALSVRTQTTNVAHDLADMLNSERKRLAYLFLSEYAASLPEIGDDERLADEWAIKEMERLGFFRS